MYFDFVTLVISSLGFEGWIWVLIASVPDLCILVTFKGVQKCKLSYYNRMKSPSRNNQLAGVEKNESRAHISIFLNTYKSFRILRDTLQFQAFETWGAQLRNQFGIMQEIKREELKRKDITLNYLGYWTDNGTYRKSEITT